MVLHISDAPGIEVIESDDARSAWAHKNGRCALNISLAVGIHREFGGSFVYNKPPCNGWSPRLPRQRGSAGTLINVKRDQIHQRLFVHDHREVIGVIVLDQTNGEREGDDRRFWFAQKWPARREVRWKGRRVG